MVTEVLNTFRMPVQAMSPEDQGFRQFEVVDPQGVELPGCQSIEQVRLNGHIIPPSEIHRVPTDTTHTHFKDLELPNYALVEGPKGNPILLRSQNSNDGMWQKGSVVHVKGEWADGKTKAPKQPADPLAAMGMSDLVAKANELGGDFKVGGTKKDDLIAFIREKTPKE